jgi:hypothetical protein
MEMSMHLQREWKLAFGGQNLVKLNPTFGMLFSNINSPTFILGST